MFTKLLPVALLFGLFANTYAYQFPLEMIDYMDDTTIIVYAKKSDIDSSSTWMPGESAPPLSIAQLVTKVDAWLQSQKGMHDLKVNEVELKKVQKHEKDNYWYYLVQLKHKKEIQYIAVLMNGKVLPAIKEPKSYK